jgi:hypothetical protein
VKILRDGAGDGAVKHDSASPIENVFYVCFHSNISLRKEDLALYVFHKMLAKSE